jgi:hypothetical protein
MSLASQIARPLSWLVVVAVPIFVIAKDDAESNRPAKGTPGVVDVRFTDGGTLKLTIKDTKVEVTTPYGKLAVPVADIQKIEFATRLTSDATKRIEDAIPNLGHPLFAKREAASMELFKLKEKSYPALLEAAKSKDAEMAHRAQDLLDRIREAVPAEQLEIRKFDVIQTEHSKFSGRIEGAVMYAASIQFGDVQLKLTDMHSLRIPGFVEEENKVVQADPDPGSLTNFNDKIGKSFYFHVTGAVNGTIWGSDVYTTDSPLATVAVHAGVLKVGQTGVVKVTMLNAPPMFNGTTRNGVASQPYGQFPAAFKVSRGGG